MEVIVVTEYVVPPYVTVFGMVIVDGVPSYPVTVALPLLPEYVSPLLLNVTVAASESSESFNIKTRPATITENANVAAITFPKEEGTNSRSLLLTK